MSGKSPSLHGIQGQRIQAAREWLNRAETQFAAGQDVLAASTLMLAQAELKLTVEDIAGSHLSAPVEANPRKFRLQPLSRTLVGAVALAACFMFGIFIGNVQTPNFPADTPDSGPAPIIQIADSQPAIEVPTPDNTAISPAEFSALETSAMEETDVPAEEHSVSTPAPTRPIHRPRVTQTPSPEPTPVNVESPAPSENISDIQIPETLEPIEVAYAPPADVPGVDTVSSEGVISEAEVALATIRFLSERLLMEVED